MLTTMKRYLWVVFFALFVSCTSTSPTEVNVSAVSTSAAATAIARMTQTAIADASATATLTITPTMTPAPTSLPLFPLDGYVVVFRKDGDLYFQYGNDLPLKLTHVGEKSFYHGISDDYQKVVFSREDGNEYSINADGTQEQIIISNNREASIKQEPNKIFFGFIPNTHLLLFGTVLCESPKYGSTCSTSIFTANTDTSEIKKLADLGFSYQNATISKNVVISPNGELIAVGTIDGMDILNIDGKIIRQDILPYVPSTSTVLFPSLFWLPDSSGLIIALPDTTYDSVAHSHVPAYTLWRYMIDGDDPIRIPLNVPIPGNNAESFDISPDGNWVVYGGLADQSLYLGNLEYGNVQVFGNNVQPSFSWGPDSEHFTYTSTNSFLGLLDKPPIFLENCDFVEWIDARHFTCVAYEQNAPKLQMAEIDGSVVKIYDLDFAPDYQFFAFIKPK